VNPQGVVLQVDCK